MLHVSLLALPEAGSSLLGAAELLASVGVTWEALIEDVRTAPRYQTQIVAASREPLTCGQRWTVQPDAVLTEVTQTDIVFIPTLWIQPGEHFAQRHAELRDWLVARYQDGALICAACTGVQLLADTGLLDGEVATTHWAYADALRRVRPAVNLQPDKILVEAGADGRLITSGSHASWHDLLLYVISRTSGKAYALQTAKFFLLQWHGDSQLPYTAFQVPTQHDDALIRTAQDWLHRNYSQPNPVTELEALTGLAPRSFKRRFKQATGHAPLAYIQHLRIDRAKALLESDEQSVEAISWKVGYEDVAFFNRLFKRLTGLTPSAYRRRFRIQWGENAPTPRVRPAVRR